MAIETTFNNKASIDEVTREIPDNNLVDYEKVFDSVPHNWILKCLHIYKIPPV